jgi:mannosyl-3-phosphoglycerate phosphatase
MSRRRQKNLIIFTDLDGTLLDDRDYRWAAARPALRALARAHCPLVIVTSKTRAEVEPILVALGRREPFGVENGGAVYIPAGYLGFIPEGAVAERGGWYKVILGAPRRRLVKKLTIAARRAEVQIRSFSQMTSREVAERTGLPLDDARRALRRQYDEPFVILNETARARSRLREEIELQGFGTTRGSRFLHITGRTDKGVAVARLAGWLRRAFGSNLLTVGLGDCSNDIPLLNRVDQPILVARPGNRYDAETLAAVPRVQRAGGVGPVGWNRAVLRLCGLASRPVKTCGYTVSGHDFSRAASDPP